MVKIIKSAKSTILKKDIESVISVLKKEFLGMGPKVREFETKLSHDFKTNVACVVNGTAAIQLALQAHSIGKNDEVLVQSLTYLSTYQAISATGAKPISCEVYQDTMTIDIEDAQNKISNKTKAIVLVHYAGGVGNLNNYYKFAKKNKLILIEDAAHAFGTTYKNKLIGSFNSTVTFSFDGIKNITSGEGGCVMSSNKSIINKVKDYRQLGIENMKILKKNLLIKKFNVSEQGWRYHMSDIMAAIGLSQYSRFKIIKFRRRQIAKYYFKNLSKFNKLKQLSNNYDEVVPFCYPITFNTKKTRDIVAKKLSESSIEVGFLYFPNHLLKKYKSNYKLNLSVKIYNNSILLPLHMSLKDSDLKKIIKIISVNLANE